MNKMECQISIVSNENDKNFANKSDQFLKDVEVSQEDFSVMLKGEGPITDSFQNITSNLQSSSEHSDKDYTKVNNKNDENNSVIKSNPDSASIRKVHKRIALIDSDSENEEQAENTVEIESQKPSFEEENEEIGVKRRAVINSDSEDDEPVTASIENPSKEPVVYVINSKGELVPENDADTDFNVQKTKLSALCDPESSEDELPTDNNKDETTFGSDDDTIKPKIYKKKSKSKKGEEKSPKKMTPKEAAEMRKEITSESQRMLRETNISLPYHKPKSYGIKEFLARRSKFASALPNTSKTPPSVAMKMSLNELKIISEKLKEREKEVREFYKSASESDNEDPEDEDYVPPSEEKKKEETQDSGIDTQEDTKSLVMLMDKTEEPKEDVSKENSDDKDMEDFKDKATGKETVNKDIEENLDKQEENEMESMEYEFNIDNADISDPIEAPTDDPDKEETPLTTTNLDKEIEEFTENNAQKPKKLTKLEMIKEKLEAFKPRLSGGPSDLIDLDTGIVKPNEVSKLMERFMQHASKKTINKPHKMKLSIVTVESGGDVHKETVAMNVDEDESETIEEKPGARLQKLREELQSQIIQKKTELWQQKAAKGISNNEENDEEEGDKDGYEDDILDDEEELTEGEDTEDEEDELEEKELVDKPRKVSAFVDDEAEDTDMEGDKDEETERDEDAGSVEDEKVDVPEEEIKVSPKKRQLKRIIKAFEDSDQEDEADELFSPAVSENKSGNQEHLDSTATAEDDQTLPPYQPQQSMTPIRQTTQSKSGFDFLTPISFITGLQNLNSATKSAKDSSPVVSPFQMPLEHSQSSMVSESLQKKLLFGESDTESSQNLDELALMCTGKFSTASEVNQISTGKDKEETPCTQDVLNLCSGEFSGISQVETQGTVKLSQASEIKNLGDDQDLIISQLLDEEELENFKKKFDSPLKRTASKTIEEAREVTGGAVIDSDDEIDEEIEVKKKKSHKKQLVFSDDSSDDEEDPANDDEEIDLHDTDGESDDEKQLDNVGYDSEENEYELTKETGPVAPKEKLKTSDFFEAEAELSESDWESEDEDEKDLDKLEEELGDTEKFDEDKMKEDLERIHMRRILDDDTREVKLLQELLLEDGELHGSGRQRQFRWKNIDSVEEGNEEQKEDDDVYLDEEESEEQWRKRRHEREMFLMEQQKKRQGDDDDDDLLSGSQILLVGQKVLQRSQSQNNSQNGTPAEKSAAPDSPMVKSAFTLLNKRGSFLSRGDQILQRLAEYNKVSTVSTGTAKNSKNFLFQTVQASETMVSVTQGNKRKAIDGTPDAIKKIRLSTLSPAVNKKKPDKFKKLFGNW